MSKEIAIVTEGELEAKVLEKLLRSKKHDSQFTIYPSSGFSSALSAVNTLLSLKESKVLLVLDTDSVDEQRIEEKKDFVNFYVNQKAHEDDLKIVWAIPEFEVIFLNNKKFVQALTDEVMDDKILDIGKLAPKKTIEKISGKNKDAYLPLFEASDISEEFHKDKLIKEIEAYLA